MAPSAEWCRMSVFIPEESADKEASQTRDYCVAAFLKEAARRVERLARVVRDDKAVASG